MKKDRAKIGRNNKRKGSNAERLYAEIFRNLGYSFCKTSRQASRILDDCGIDLANIPYNIQIKAGYQRGINYSEVLGEINKNLEKNFPPEDSVHQQINMVIHRKDVGRGKKRSNTDDLVVMTFEDFKKLMSNESF